MADKPVTREYLDKSLDKLGVMIAKGFNESAKEHQQIFNLLDKIEKILTIESRGSWLLAKVASKWSTRQK